VRIVQNFCLNHPIRFIGLITEWWAETGKLETRDENSDLGGSMRLGGQKCRLQTDSLAFSALSKRCHYRKDIVIVMSFNNSYIEKLEKAGVRFSGKSIDGRLV